MSLWTLEPRDPLVVRDGRPSTGRSASATLPFPNPGTIAGIVRTRLGSDERGVFDAGQIEALRSIAIRGPLLARLDDGAFYVPPPRDALVSGQVIHRLSPIPTPPDALFDSAFSGLPVGRTFHEAHSNGKPEQAPAWWPWELLARWLAEPAALDGGDTQKLLGGALPRLPDEIRSHVKHTDTWTAEDSMLFQTRGLRFVTPARAPLALAVDLDASTLGGRTLRRGLGPSGGERRLARWEAAPSWTLPALPGGVRAALRADVPCVRVRVVLLTPAIFNEGSTPGAGPEQLLGARAGITPALVAACVPRPETLSGWDFAKRQPKKTRRLVSAGSVVWLDLEGPSDARIRWAEEVMMTNVSDEAQDRRDGFGLAAVGVGS